MGNHKAVGSCTKQIVVNNVKKSFGDHTVLSGVSFEITQGSIYGLIGRNGAGKTTLLTIIAELQSADSGEINTNGLTVGYLPDVPEYYDYLTAGEYIQFLQKKIFFNKNEKIDVLNKVSLDPKTKIKSMSRGTRQRLGIASVLLNNPDIILLDEPTSALDPSGRLEVRNILKQLKDEGKIIILSTHILDDMEVICDYVGFLRDGKIQKEFEITSLKKSGAIQVKFQNAFVDREFKYISYQKKSPYDITFIIPKNNIQAGQKEVFSYFSETDNIIESISNDFIRLDDLFKEYC